MLTLLTTTGARPQAWALCCAWMAAQSFAGPVRWVIVDDGPTAAPTPTPGRVDWLYQHIRPTPHWQPGQNTQARNLLMGLAVIKGWEKVVIIEDDDFYDHDWLTRCFHALRESQLYGEGLARYYNVQRRVFKEHRNLEHASLCSTAFTGPVAYKALVDACQSGEKFIDTRFWASVPANVKHVTVERSTVGIKGLPGRPGIGYGHAPRFPGRPDPLGQVLKNWVGPEAAALYQPFYIKE